MLFGHEFVIVVHDVAFVHFADIQPQFCAVNIYPLFPEFLPLLKAFLFVQKVLFSCLFSICFREALNKRGFHDVTTLNCIDQLEQFFAFDAFFNFTDFFIPLTYCNVCFHLLFGLLQFTNCLAYLIHQAIMFLFWFDILVQKPHTTSQFQRRRLRVSGSTHVRNALTFLQRAIWLPFLRFGQNVLVLLRHLLRWMTPSWPRLTFSFWVHARFL